MNVLVSLEHRFERTPDGAVWTSAQFAYPFWTRYLEVFDSVRVLARVRDVPTKPQNWLRADGSAVSFAAVPYYVGPWQYLKKYFQIARVVRQAAAPGEAVILRVPSPVGGSFVAAHCRGGRPYSVEVVADPYDVFAPGACNHPLRAFFRWAWPRRMRQLCRNASTALYVTRYALQRRYTCPQNEVGVSDVELPPAALVPASRPVQPDKTTFTLISVGTFAQLYKAPDVLIDAVALCVRQGLDLRLVLVGDGKHRAELEARAAAHGLGTRVDFPGLLPAGETVRKELDRADLFVLPSHQEGLPRAMVEAMARALPCIGSTVGGFPELLPVEEMVPPGDAAALAAKIREVVTDAGRLAQMSARNLAKAQTYRDEVLHELRQNFYREVRAKTAAWLEGQGRRAASPMLHRV